MTSAIFDMRTVVQIYKTFLVILRLCFGLHGPIQLRSLSALMPLNNGLTLRGVMKGIHKCLVQDSSD
jgi:hypothetical protein